MSVNMQLPPPSVTGVAIPANLSTNGDMAIYKELQDIRRQARDGLTSDHGGLYLGQGKGKGKNKTKKILKYTAGVLLAVASFIGLKKLFKK